MGHHGGGWRGHTPSSEVLPATQTTGYKFGIGQSGVGGGSGSNGIAGAGGGYYGGFAVEQASGGSSFVSGNENCNAISKESTESDIIHTNQANHYSGKIFINSKTIDGEQEMIVEDLKKYKYNINDGNGYAKITFLGKEENAIDTEYLYYYTGNEQKFIAPKSGNYKIECWGASGGKARADGSVAGNGGNGGYTSGIIHLNNKDELYIHIGGKGADAVVGQNSEGGYNGGGLGTWDYGDDEASGGGRRSNRYKT